MNEVSKVFWISGRGEQPGDNNNTFVIVIIPYGRINSRMTSYLKIFATERTNLKTNNQASKASKVSLI